MASNHFRDLEAEYIAAATSDDDVTAQEPPHTGSVWGTSEPDTTPYAIGVTEEIEVTAEMAAGYLLDDPFGAIVEPEYVVATVTSTISIVGHIPTESEMQDALSDAFIA